jgi:hypothetical protein
MTRNIVDANSVRQSIKFHHRTDQEGTRSNRMSVPLWSL